MINSIRLLVCLCLLTVGCSVFAQDEPTPEVIQFSGLVLTDENGRLEPVPFTTVSVKGSTRGTYTNLQGFFSIAVRPDEVIKFTAVGYANSEITVPDTLTDNRYSVVQMLSTDTFNLPDIVIFPWPDRDNFRIEFLAMDINRPLEAIAESHLEQKRLAQLSAMMKMDGVENTSFYMRSEAQKYYYIGQVAPMPIFSPLAWAEFFKAWKDGKFKKKDQ